METRPVKSAGSGRGWKRRGKREGQPLRSNKVEVSGLRVMMTNVRASNLHPTLQEDILHPWPPPYDPPFYHCRPTPTAPPTHSQPFSPRFSSSCRASCRGDSSRGSRAPLPSCLRPSSRRFGKLPLFFSRREYFRGLAEPETPERRHRSYTRPARETLRFRFRFRAEGPPVRPCRDVAQTAIRTPGIRHFRTTSVVFEQLSSVGCSRH